VAWPRARAQASADSGSSYRTNRGAPAAEQLGDADVERSARSLNSLQPARARACAREGRPGVPGRAAHGVASRACLSLEDPVWCRERTGQCAVSGISWRQNRLSRSGRREALCALPQTVSHRSSHALRVNPSASRAKNSPVTWAGSGAAACGPSTHRRRCKFGALPCQRVGLRGDIASPLARCVQTGRAGDARSAMHDERHID